MANLKRHPHPPVEEAREVTIDEKINAEIDWSNYIDEYNSPGKVNFETENREAPQYEAFVSSKESLSDHLLWQLLMLSPTDIEKQVGSLIIGNLNRDGYLQLSVEDLCRAEWRFHRDGGRCVGNHAVI